MKIQYSSFISADKAAERVSNAKKYFISSLLDEIKSPFTNSDFEVSNNNIINNRGLGRGWRRKKTKRLSIDEKKISHGCRNEGEGDGEDEIDSLVSTFKVKRKKIVKIKIMWKCYVIPPVSEFPGINTWL